MDFNVLYMDLFVFQLGMPWIHHICHGVDTFANIMSTIQKNVCVYIVLAEQQMHFIKIH